MTELRKAVVPGSTGMTAHAGSGPQDGRSWDASGEPSR